MTGMIRYRPVMTHIRMFTRSSDMNSGSFCGAVGPLRGHGVGLGWSKKATVWQVSGRRLTSNDGKSLTPNGCDFNCVSKATV